MTVTQKDNGLWVGVTSWGYGEDSAWATKEMARAVSEMPEPSVGDFMREVSHWKKLYKDLQKALDDHPEWAESLRGHLYLLETRVPGSPLQMQALGFALNAKKRYSEDHDTE